MNKEDAIKKIVEIAKDINIAMFTTMDDQGALRSRPMSCVKVEEASATCWFFTNEYSEKVDELKNENDINLSFSNPAKQDFISLSGEVELITDRQKMEELWSPIIKAWFPEGLDSDRLALLKFTPTKGEYWDGSSSKIIQLYKISKAILTGQPYDAGKHEKIEL